VHAVSPTPPHRCAFVIVGGGCCALTRLLLRPLHQARITERLSSPGRPRPSARDKQATVPPNGGAPSPSSGRRPDGEPGGAAGAGAGAGAGGASTVASFELHFVTPGPLGIEFEPPPPASPSRGVPGACKDPGRAVTPSDRHVVCALRHWREAVEKPPSPRCRSF
jgi:hypothetical protein